MAITINIQGKATLDAACKVRHDAIVSLLHAGAKYIERSDGICVRATLLVEDVAQRFSNPLAFIVACAWPLAGDISTVTFRGWHINRVRIAVYFTRRKERES